MSRRGPIQAQKFDPKTRKEATRKFAASLKPYFVPFLIASLLLIGDVLCQIFAPTYLAGLTNAIAVSLKGQKINLSSVQTYAILLVILYGVAALCSYVGSYLLRSIAQLYSRDLRKEIIAKIQRLPLSYFDKTPYGDILSRITNDVDTMGQSIEQSIGTLVESILMLVGTSIAMFVSSWEMALVVVAVLPVTIASVLLMAKIGMPAFMARQKTLGEIEAQNEEAYAGQTIIKAFGAEERSIASFDEKNEQMSHSLFTGDLIGGTMQPISSFASYLAYAAVCLVGGLLMNAGRKGIDYGSISQFLVYVRLFQSPLSQIAQSVNSLQSGVAASQRVFEFLGQPEMENEAGKARKLSQNGKEVVKGEVVFDHVNFSYDPSREIIHDFSTVAKPGQKVAIVGPTGAGKTTMVNLLMRFYEVNSGSISIDGVPIKEMPREEIRDIFAMVLQDTWIFEGTLRENLVYNAKGIGDDEIRQVLEEVGLSHFLESLPQGLDSPIGGADALSSGEKQLLTIARAMLKKAPLLILDEATSNVDTCTEEKIQVAMDKLSKGRTSFIIAHRLFTVKNADLILVMKDGDIVEQGTHEELLAKNGFYASLYNSQFAFLD